MTDKTKTKVSKGNQKIGFLKSLSSALMERSALAARAGMQFGTKRNLYDIYGYKTDLTYRKGYHRLLNSVATFIMTSIV